MNTRITSVVFFLGLVACIAATSPILLEPETPCINYCEEGKLGNYICCDDHPGKCPRSRLTCPGATRLSRPVFCEHDGHCAARQKCCSDVCLPNKKICKPAQF